MVSDMNTDRPGREEAQPNNTTQHVRRGYVLVSPAAGKLRARLSGIWQEISKMAAARAAPARDGAPKGEGEARRPALRSEEREPVLPGPCPGP